MMGGRRSVRAACAPLSLVRRRWFRALLIVATDDDRTGRVHRIASRRTHRSPLGGHGFRATGHSRPEIGSCDGGGAPKTEASRKDVPLDAQTAESLFAWRQMCPYPGPGDWVFASPVMKRKQPYWPGTQWRYYGKPALKRHVTKPAPARMRETGRHDDRTSPTSLT